MLNKCKLNISKTLLPKSRVLLYNKNTNKRSVNYGLRDDLMSNTSYKEDFIEKLYTKIDIHLPHQLDLKEIAYRLGIQLYHWNNSSQVLFLKDKAYIFLEEGLTPQRTWQDFCHELCHVLFHSGSQANMPYSWIEYQEWKANNFALQACVPTFMLNKIKLPLNEEKAINKISLLFNVEYDFAQKRINHYLNNHFFSNCTLLERSC